MKSNKSMGSARERVFLLMEAVLYCDVGLFATRSSPRAIASLACPWSLPVRRFGGRRPIFNANDRSLPAKENHGKEARSGCRQGIPS